MPEDFNFTVDYSLPTNTRIDVFLAAMLPQFSRNRLKQAILDELVLLNGKPCKPRTPLSPQDHITVSANPLQPEQPQPEDIPLDILYEDQDLMVINKPAGMVVHPGNGNRTGTVVNAVLNHCDSQDFDEMLDDESRPGIVHRLDKDTSGALLIAKNSETQTALKQAFKEHRVHKTYLAIVSGKMPRPEGTINLPLGPHPSNPLKRAVRLEDGKEAITDYRTIGKVPGKDASLLKVRIHTGRTHQIRVHLAYLGHPILGDTLYGGRREDAARQMLHAWKISFLHPKSGKKITITAPPTPILEFLGLGNLPNPETNAILKT